jgi:acyl carrier protein
MTSYGGGRQGTSPASRSSPSEPRSEHRLASSSADERLSECLASLIADELGVPASSLSPQTRFAEDLHIDSLTAVELVMVIEDELDIGLGNADMAQLATFGDLCRTVTRQTSQHGRAD